MTAKSVSKARAAPWLAFIPGLGHLALGRRFKGAHLLTVTMLGVFLLIWRAERVAAAFSSRAIDQWLASLVLIGSLSLAIAYSRRDVGRLLEQEDQPLVVNKSPWGVAIRRFKENKLAVISIYVIVLLYVMALLTPLLAPYDPSAIDNVLETRYMSPSGAHLFGTDEFGRDMFSRALYGARVSLSVGFLAMLISKGL